MVRDHKVVGSNPVASTKKAGEQRLACLFELQRGKKRDSRGGKQARLAQVGGNYRRHDSP